MNVRALVHTYPQKCALYILDVIISIVLYRTQQTWPAVAMSFVTVFTPSSFGGFKHTHERTCTRTLRIASYILDVIICIVFRRTQKTCTIMAKSLCHCFSILKNDFRSDIEVLVFNKCIMYC